MNTRITSFLVLGFAVVGLGGCATTTTTEIEVDPSFDPQRYQTYFMLPLPTNSSLEHRLPELVKALAPLAERAVDAVMVEKGFTPVGSAEAADLVVLIHGELTPKSQILLDQSFNPSTIRPGPSLDRSLTARNPGVTHRYDYNEAKLIVEVHDVAADRMVWVAWSQRELDKLARPPAQRVAGNITRLLGQFPGREQGP